MSSYGTTRPFELHRMNCTDSARTYFICLDSVTMAASDMNPFMPSRFFYLKYLDKSLSRRRGVWLVLLVPWFIEIPVVNANKVDPV